MLDHNFLDYPRDRGGTHNQTVIVGFLPWPDHDDVWRWPPVRRPKPSVPATIPGMSRR
jgi:hypothetical protein